MSIGQEVGKIVREEQEDGTAGIGCFFDDLGVTEEEYTDFIRDKFTTSITNSSILRAHEVIEIAFEYGYKLGRSRYE